MSRILIWAPGYAPELIGIPPLVTDAASWLAGHGHDVEVLVPVPSNPHKSIHRDYRGVLWRSERHGGVVVRRSWLRVRVRESFVDKALWEATFAATSWPSAVRGIWRCDAVLCVVPPLLTTALASMILRLLRRSRGRWRFVIWVQDLVLEAARSLDRLPVGADRTLRLASALERAAFRSADAVVVCSDGFREHLHSLGVDRSRVVTVHNWADTVSIGAQTFAANGHTRFLYAGNVGYTQGLETLVEAARLAGDAVEVSIVGAGNDAENVRRLAASASNVGFESPVPREQFPQLLASADAHVVVQRRAGAGPNLPSKIATYLASGRPVVAAIPSETAAADLLRRSGGALLVPPESPVDLAAAMGRLHAEPELRRQLGERGRAFAVANLSKEGALERLAGVVLGSEERS